MGRLGVVVALLLASAARAQSDDAHRHSGVYLELEGGLGFMVGSESSVTVSGPTVDLGISLGGPVAGNLDLAGSVFGLSVINPTFSSGGTSGQATSTSFGMVGIGPRLIYYFMPANFYLSGTVGLCRFSATTNSVSASTDIGPVARFALGKEWWVSSHWGLGFSGILTLATNNDPSNNSSNRFTLTTWATSMGFSATLN